MLSSRAKRSVVEGPRGKVFDKVTGFLDSARNDGEFCGPLLRWYRKNGRDLPWRRTRDPYAILVSEFMLQQTQVATVIPYYIEWLRRFPDFTTLAAAPESDVLHAWQGLGYYNRARNLHATAKAIVTNHDGAFPLSAEIGRQLPGLGRYTANAVATFAFDHSVPLVEANIARLLARMNNIRISIDTAAGREMLWSAAEALLPACGAGLHNSALMDLGATVCTPRAPKCGECPAQGFCRAPDPMRLPIKNGKPKTVQLIERHGLALRRGKILLEQSSTRWRGMWILPRLPESPAGATALYRAAFPFTHHRVNLEVFRVPSVKSPGRRWFSVDDIASIAIPSPHRRALNALLNSTLDVGR